MLPNLKAGSRQLTIFRSTIYVSGLAHHPRFSLAIVPYWLATLVMYVTVARRATPVHGFSRSGLYDSKDACRWDRGPISWPSGMPTTICATALFIYLAIPAPRFGRLPGTTGCSAWVGVATSVPSHL